MKYAPIAIFVYKRPEHTRQVLTALMQCPEFEHSPVYVFCDAAKKTEDQEEIDKTREVVRSMLGEKVELEMVKAAQNQGIKKSFSIGIDLVLNNYDRVIVLEDDLIVKAGFLQYMNMALEAYQNEPTVMQISAYMFPVQEFVKRTEAMFLPFTTSWGWATWKRAWVNFDPEATGWEILQSDREMCSRFDLDNNFDYFRMMKKQIAGESDTWDIQWYWSVFKNQGLVLFPPVSYVKNIGFEGSGSHGFLTAKLLFESKQDLMETQLHLPKIISINSKNFKSVKSAIGGFRGKILSFLRNTKDIFISIGK